MSEAKDQEMLTNAQMSELFKDAVHNITTIRREAIAKALDPRRDINRECGYPDKVDQIDVEDYQRQYDRNPYGSATVELYPEECWKVSPVLVEDADPEAETEFEAAFEEVGKGLNGAEESYFEDENDNPIWEYTKRIDTLSSIGKYGVLLLGFDDGKEFKEDVQPKNGMKLLYIRPFSQGEVSVSKYETDKTSPMFGRPIEYTISFINMDDVEGKTAMQLETLTVHWRRVIHVPAPLKYSSNDFGQPSQQVVYNNLLDLYKILGCSAEGFWKSAFKGLVFKSQPQLGGRVEVDLDKKQKDGKSMREQMDEYMNNLSRYLALTGFDTETIDSEASDPTNHVDVQVEAICVKKRCPKRVFLGSEAGELASSQDHIAWNTRVEFVQNDRCTKRIVVPLVNRLIQVGVLPKPKRYGLDWPDLGKLPRELQAQIAFDRARALATYARSGVDGLISPVDFFIKELGFSKEDADRAVKHAREKAAETGTQQALIPQQAPGENGNGNLSAPEN